MYLNAVVTFCNSGNSEIPSLGRTIQVTRTVNSSLEYGSTYEQCVPKEGAKIRSMIPVKFDDLLKIMYDKLMRSTKSFD